MSVDRYNAYQQVRVSDLVYTYFCPVCHSRFEAFLKADLLTSCRNRGCPGKPTLK